MVPLRHLHSGSCRNEEGILPMGWCSEFWPILSVRSNVKPDTQSSFKLSVGRCFSKEAPHNCPYLRRRLGGSAYNRRKIWCLCLWSAKVCYPEEIGTRGARTTCTFGRRTPGLFRAGSGVLLLQTPPVGISSISDITRRYIETRWLHISNRKNNPRT